MKSLQTNEYQQIFLKDMSLQIHLPSSLQSSTAVRDREEKRPLESNCLEFEPWLTYLLTVVKLHVLSVPYLYVHAQSLQSCLTLCNPMDGSPPGFPPSTGFSRQEYWSELPCPSPGNLPYPGVKPRSPALQADSLRSELPRKPVLQMGK